MRRLLVIAIVILALLYAVNLERDVTEPPEVAAEPGVGMVTDERIRDADAEPGAWLAYGRDYQEQRFSPLDQINRETIDRLGLAWFVDMR